MWAVRYHPDAKDEEDALLPREQLAMTNVVNKLQTVGPALGFPHQSAVQSSTVRELRPRSGRSSWRAFYRRVGDHFVIGAIGPEALSNPNGFRKAVGMAETRLNLNEKE